MGTKVDNSFPEKVEPGDNKFIADECFLSKTLIFKYSRTSDFLLFTKTLSTRISETMQTFLFFLIYIHIVFIDKK